MSLFFLLFLILIIFIFFIISNNIKKGKKMYLNKENILNIIIFLFSLVSLLISLNLFINLGRYVNEYGTSPSVVLGGIFWSYMDWLRLLLTFVICSISGVRLFK